MSNSACILEFCQGETKKVKNYTKQYFINKFDFNLKILLSSTFLRKQDESHDFEDKKVVLRL